MPYSILISIFTLLLLPGIAGVILPVLPGLLYMAGIAIIFGIIDQFIHLQVWELGLLVGLTLISLLIDYLSGILGAKFGGASRQAILYGTIGLLIGTVLLPPFGGLLGLFGGIWVIEYGLNRNKTQAIKAATGGVIGSVSGMAINIVLAIAFVMLFVFFALK